jgi:hypothetical protein
MNTNKNYDFGYITELSDEELISRFNREVGIRAWGNARSAFLNKIHDEFLKRKFDSRLIADKETMSFARKVKIENNRIVYQ